MIGTQSTAFAGNSSFPIISTYYNLYSIIFILKYLGFIFYLYIARFYFAMLVKNSDSRRTISNFFSHCAQDLATDNKTEHIFVNRLFS